MMASVLWDVGRLLWLITLLGVITCLPALIKARTRRPYLMSLIEHLPGTALVVIVTVSILSPLRLLNPVTLALALACWPISWWVVGHRAAPAHDAALVLRRAIFGGAVWWESGNRWHTLMAALRAAAAEFGHGARAFGATSGPAILVLVAATVMVAPRLIEALLNTRLVGANAYAELVATQQLLTSELGWTVPRPFAATAAALALVSSFAPVHVVRLLLPLIGFATLVALIIAVHRWTSNLGAALVTALLLALLAPGYSRSPGNEFADLFLLLSLFFWHVTLTDERKYKWAAAACTVVAGLAAPVMLIAMCVAVGGMLLWPRLILLTTGAAWLGLSWLASSGVSEASAAMDMSALVNVPLAASLLFAGVFHLAVVTLRCESGARRIAITATAAAVVVLAMVPRTTAAHYVEYDASARQSLEIAETLPRYRYLIVAPVEQWALTYGRGWHMNLYEFVETVGARAGDAGYSLPYQVDDVLVFVETRPFAMFDHEPQQVSFPVLTDPVFRHYRSLAGRSSLQFAALQVCERLRQTHPSSASIYYDDGQLRIYRFRLR